MSRFSAYFMSDCVVTAPLRAFAHLCSSNFPISLSRSLLKMTEFAASPAFYCLCLAWREIREEREASASAINCCRRCWAVVKGLVETRTAFALLCLWLLPHIYPFTSVSGSQVEVLSTHHLCWVHSLSAARPHSSSWPAVSQIPVVFSRSWWGYVIWIQPIRPEADSRTLKGSGESYFTIPSNLSTLWCRNQQIPELQTHQLLALQGYLFCVPIVGEHPRCFKEFRNFAIGRIYESN